MEFPLSEGGAADPGDNALLAYNLKETAFKLSHCLYIVITKIPVL